MALHFEVFRHKALFLLLFRVKGQGPRGTVFWGLGPLFRGPRAQLKWGKPVRVKRKKRKLAGHGGLEVGTQRRGSMIDPDGGLEEGRCLMVSPGPMRLLEFLSQAKPMHLTSEIEVTLMGGL